MLDPAGFRCRLNRLLTRLCEGSVRLSFDFENRSTLLAPNAFSYVAFVGVINSPVIWAANVNHSAPPKLLGAMMLLSLELLCKREMSGIESRKQKPACKWV